MTARSDRLHHVLRKQRIELRLAELALAKAEKERTALSATAAQLGNLRLRLAVGEGVISASLLAEAGEWSGRIAEAVAKLDAPMQAATAAHSDETRSVQVASTRVEILERNACQAARAEAAHRDQRRASVARMVKARSAKR